MSNPVKVMLYVVLVLLAGISGYFALSHFSQLMSRSASRNSELEQIEVERKPPAENPPAEGDSTLATNIVATASGTNSASATNATNVPDPSVTNQATNSSNTVALADAANTNSPSTAETKVEKPTNSLASTVRPLKQTRTVTAKPSGGLGFWAGLFVLSLVALGLLLANDLSHYFGNKALNVLYNDDDKAGAKDPEYEQAEQLWADGNHLEAIRMMREYLVKNPREQYVAIRIAEIYEKDLGNNLAAALEYEEVLKHKLPSERWSWAAIHLCNLYFRLSQEQKGFELLRRIVKEHPNTAAADKARKRLEQIDGSASTEELATEHQVSAKPETPRGANNLPPGFRPKK